MMSAAASCLAPLHILVEDCGPETPVGEREDGISEQRQHVISADNTSAVKPFTSITPVSQFKTLFIHTETQSIIPTDGTS